MRTKQRPAEVFAANGGWAYLCNVCGDTWYRDSHSDVIDDVHVHLAWHANCATMWPR